jgi:Tol biopolymer transport system component
MSSAMALTSGTKLGGYEIIGVLGAGGMGEVYRARDPQLRREVAIKILPASLARDPERLRRFEQEARAAAALNHPNILAVYQLGTHDGAPYLVSELLEGGTLREKLARGALPFRKAVDYGAQTARGLAAAHEKGIVHRDLKPENLFVTNDGRLKILDFGLAKLIQKPEDADHTPTVSGQTEAGVVLGTAGYMAPEQVRGQSADHPTDHRADLFALGAILYEMLTGRRSFHRPTSAETMTAILNDEPPAISTVVPDTPLAVQRVVQRCLEKNPEQRFHSASDLAFALEALSDSGSGWAGGSQAVNRPSFFSWKVAAVAGAIIVVIAAVLFYFGRAAGVPVVESVTQLTNDENPKSGASATDGARVYFNQGAQGSYKIAQVSVNGGQTAEVATTLNNPEIAGLTGDGSNLFLLVSGALVRSEQMWSLPLPAGEPRRLGSMDVDDASLFPDGRIIYAKGNAVFVAEKDGSNPRQLDQLSKYGIAPNVSPDGKRLVFSSYDTAGHVYVLHESLSDGTGLHDVLRSETKGLPRRICCARWTPDEKYLIFPGESGGRWDLWAVPDQKPMFGGDPSPVRLTNGPLSYTDFVPSRDGKQIFAVCSQKRGELTRFEPGVHEFVPFLGGISALDPTFSREGQWVTYVSYPDRTLWRSRADGSERLQLTYPPQRVFFARISPDGSKVAFSDGDAISYVLDAKGGTPRKLAEQATAPDWSPDGNLLAVTSFVRDPSLPNGVYFQLRIIDVGSGQLSVIPDSRGKIGPWFIGQDAIIAVNQDQSKFQRFDFKTQKWSDMITSPGQFLNWEASPDGRYFFYGTGGNDPRIFRMRLADRAVEEVTTVKGFAAVDDPTLSVSPDDSPVLTRNTGTQEICALSVKWP